MSNFVNNILAAIEKNNMISSGDTVIVGVSGGADSLCLLHVLNTLKKELNIKIFAAHLNHQFRGVEADQDAAFVDQICKDWEIPHIIRTFDVAAYAKEMGLSSEEAGREMRYKLFDEVKETVKGNKIAVAQNLNDNVETILMRLIRGTGLEGLKGIDAVRNDIIRPLLEQDRQSIELYCAQNDLQPRVDKTNLQPIYLRNKIRLELIPHLKQRYNPNIEEAVIRLGQVVREENSYLEQQTNELLRGIGEIKSDSISIKVDSLKQLHPAMQKRLLRKAVESVAKTLNGFEYKHFLGIIELFDRSTGAAIELPKGMRAHISYENLIISKKIENTDKKCYYKLKYDYENFIEEINEVLSVKMIKVNELSGIPKSHNTIYIDADKVKHDLVVRSREQGDVISPIGMRGSKKLKEYFIDKKIPREERDKVLLLADDHEIIWILGGIISDKYKITSNTQNVIVLSCNNYSFLHNNMNRAKEEQHA